MLTMSIKGEVLIKVDAKEFIRSFIFVIVFIANFLLFFYFFKYFFYYYFFLFRPLGISLHFFLVRALYPEPRTRPYEIRIYLHHSALRAFTAGQFRPTRPPTIVGKVCLVTSSESDLSPLDIVCTP